MRTCSTSFQVQYFNSAADGAGVIGGFRAKTPFLDIMVS